MSEIKPSEWWALVNRGGYICDVRRTRKEIIEAFQAHFDGSEYEPWENIRRRWGMSIRRVLVTAAEERP